jgi:hypothetical protein
MFTNQKRSQPFNFLSNASCGKTKLNGGNGNTSLFKFKILHTVESCFNVNRECGHKAARHFKH